MLLDSISWITKALFVIGCIIFLRWIAQIYS